MRVWRLIPSSFVPPQGQMAYDRELFRSFQPGDSPILRFFFFKTPTLTLGRAEANHLDLKSLAFPHEIRPTGGRSVFHGEGDLCYSVTASTSDPLVGGSLLESYLKISGFLAEALRGLGRAVELSSEKPRGIEEGHCFSSPSTHELILAGKKVAGSAQAREGGAFHQQGVILLSVSRQWTELFSGMEESPMTGLNEEGFQPLLDRESVERAVSAAFEKKGVHFEGFAPGFVSV